MWMLLLNLAPAIKSGLVQVHGIDLKGGVEHALGLCACSPGTRPPWPQAVVLLEDAVTAMLARVGRRSPATPGPTPRPRPSRW